MTRVKKKKKKRNCCDGGWRMGHAMPQGSQTFGPLISRREPYVEEDEEAEEEGTVIVTSCACMRFKVRTREFIDYKTSMITD